MDTEKWEKLFSPCSLCLCVKFKLDVVDAGGVRRKKKPWGRYTPTLTNLHAFTYNASTCFVPLSLPVERSGSSCPRPGEGCGARAGASGCLWCWGGGWAGRLPPAGLRHRRTRAPEDQRQPLRLRPRPPPRRLHLPLPPRQRPHPPRPYHRLRPPSPPPRHPRCRPRPAPHPRLPHRPRPRPPGFPRPRRRHRRLRRRPCSSAR